jgi:acyl-CoA thioesterase-1
MTVRGTIAVCLILVFPTRVACAESTIMVVGDSLSSGYGLAGAPSWVQMLEDHIEREAYEYAVINASIAGDTSSGGLSRLPGLLSRHHPDIVIIELGGNDGLRGQPISLLRNNLATMIEEVLAAGARPLLTGIQIPPNYGPAYTSQFAAVYGELAERYAIPRVEFLMDGVALDPERMQADRMHPNQYGQRRLFENVWAVLADML